MGRELLAALIHIGLERADGRTDRTLQGDHGIADRRLIGLAHLYVQCRGTGVGVGGQQYGRQGKLQENPVHQGSARQ